IHAAWHGKSVSVAASVDQRVATPIGSYIPGRIHIHLTIAAVPDNDDDGFSGLHETVIVGISVVSEADLVGGGACASGIAIQKSAIPSCGELNEVTSASRPAIAIAGPGGKITSIVVGIGEHGVPVGHAAVEGNRSERIAAVLVAAGTDGPRCRGCTQHQRHPSRRSQRGGGQPAANTSQVARAQLTQVTSQVDSTRVGQGRTHNQFFASFRARRSGSLWPRKKFSSNLKRRRM